MTAAHTRRTGCRLCSSERLTEVLKLTPTPPANAFVKAEALARPQQAFPLDLFLCSDCGHLQLLDVVDPAVLFEDYVYVSGTSPVFVKHFQDYAEDVLRRFAVPPRSLVVDIGSNDGTLLRFFQKAGMRALGIDPAKDIAAQANAAGVETLPVFFNERLGNELRVQRGPAHVVTANNVFAHADDLKGMLAGARALLAQDGVFVFEVSYLVDVVEKTLFDTIYHEHLAYHAVKPLVPFFKACGLELIGARRVQSHGGSLRGVAQLAGGPGRADASVAELVALEEKLGLQGAEAFGAFGRKIDALKAELHELLAGLKAKGKRIAGFGAPAKATTLMYHFGLGPDLIDFIVDDSPLKQGLYSPGLHIPVVPSRAVAERKPDYLLILAWNFAEPIMAKNKAFSDQGGRFIVPVPAIEVR
ncbi:MAG: methyltransferase domain-containing protein [Elusimicrobia bacterium]|nr:methyltransferase domain-containing protein [Elusimicrobiota bacterium]